MTFDEFLAIINDDKKKKDDDKKALVDPVKEIFDKSDTDAKKGELSKDEFIAWDKLNNPGSTAD